MSLCQSGFHSIDDFASLSTLRSTRLPCGGSPLVTVYPDLPFTILDPIHLASLILMMSILYLSISFTTWSTDLSVGLIRGGYISAVSFHLLTLVQLHGLRCFCALLHLCFLMYASFVPFPGWGCQPYGQPPTWSARVSFVWLSHRDLSSMVDPAGGTKAPPWHTSRQTTTPTTR